MKKSKYVIFRNKHAVIFPVTINHSYFRNNNVTSAGFVDYDLRCDPNDRDICEDFVFVSTYGESVSLDIKSNKEDAKLVCETLNGFDCFSQSEKVFKINKPKDLK